MPPVVDGVGDYTFNIAREFARHGHRVCVVCRRGAMVRTQYDDIRVCPVVEKYDREGARTVLRLMREERPDVVSLQYVPHGYEPHGLPFGLVGFIGEIRKTGTPLFTFCHEVYWHYRGWNLKYLAESLLMAQVSKRILKRSDIVATSITHYAAMIRRLSGKQVPTIPIASNIPVGETDAAEIEELRKRIAPGGEFIVSFIGKRDTAVASLALQRLIAEGYSIKVLLIGKTNGVQGIDDSHCYHTGVLDIADLSRYVAVADCMVMPEEGVSGCSFKSGSLAAALSYGLPVITTRGVMTDATLRDRENIIFVNPRSADDYCRAIASLADDREFAARVSRGARAVGDRLTWEETYRKYMDILSSVKSYQSCDCII